MYNEMTYVTAMSKNPRILSSKKTVSIGRLLHLPFVISCRTFVSLFLRHRVYVRQQGGFSSSRGLVSPSVDLHLLLLAPVNLPLHPPCLISPDSSL